MRRTKRIRNVAFLGLLVTLLWAGPVSLRAGYVDPTGTSWCPDGMDIVAEYQGTYSTHEYPTCDLCCNPEVWISAEEWCQTVDEGDYVTGNTQNESCTCCKWRLD